MELPRAALVAIGDELLNGTTVNTNASWLAGELVRAGVRVARVLTVGDRAEDIIDALVWAREHADLVVCSGGLGPTQDDRTRDAVAAAFGVKLREDPGTVAWLRDRFERLGRPMADSNRRQAHFPEGARILDNAIGSAPGFALRGPGGGTLFALPGVPAELRLLYAEHVLPWLRTEHGAALRAASHRILRTTGVSESGLADRLEALAGLEGVELAYLPSTGGVDLHVRAPDAGTLEAASRAIEAEVGEGIFARGPQDLVEVVAARLRARGWTLALAESCTGGLLAGRITSFAGASDYFLGALVTYSNRSKTGLAGVDGDILERFGAVSAECAGALAAGARARLGADAALAITGIAGPAGGTPAKPVGTVFVAALTPDAEEVRELHLTGDREAIRERSAQAALNLLRSLA